MSEQSLVEPLERFFRAVCRYFVTVGKVKADTVMLPPSCLDPEGANRIAQFGTSEYPISADSLTGLLFGNGSVPLSLDPEPLPETSFFAALDVSRTGNELVLALTARQKPALRLRRFLRSVASARSDQAWKQWSDLELILEGIWHISATPISSGGAPPGSPTPPTEGNETVAVSAVALPPSEGDAALAAFLADNPGATEKKALAAVNAALPPKEEQWNLDKLRKHPIWKVERKNRMIGEYMDSYYEATGKDATVSQIVKNTDYARDTIQKSEAYRDRLPARNARRDQKRQDKVREEKDEKDRKRCAEMGELLRAYAMECADHFFYCGGDDPHMLKVHLTQCATNPPKTICRAWPGYVRRLRGEKLTRLFKWARQRHEESMMHEDEAAIDEKYRRIKRAAQKWDDNHSK